MRFALKKITTAITICLLFLCAASPEAKAQKIGSFCRLLNADALRVEGIGIVTGLNGTGDGANAAKVMLQKYFEANKYNLSMDDLTSKNIAVVMVTAKLEPFIRPGARIQIRVSSLTNAAALKDGVLKSTYLHYHTGGPAIVRALGRVSTGDNPTTGIIEKGGEVLNTELLNRTIVNKDGVFYLILKNPNYTNAMTVASNINGDIRTNPARKAEYGFKRESKELHMVARAIDAGQVMVKIPQEYKNKEVAYISVILDGIDVPLESKASIRINRQSGIAVVSGEVSVMPGFISYRGRTVTLNNPEVNQRQTYDIENDTPRSMVDLIGPGESGGAGRYSLQSLVNTLSAMRCTTDDIITILKKLEQENLIQAELIVE